MTGIEKDTKPARPFVIDANAPAASGEGEWCPATPGLRFWAFVSSTHNSTQHVTLELPD